MQQNETGTLAACARPPPVCARATASAAHSHTFATKRSLTITSAAFSSCSIRSMAVAQQPYAGKNPASSLTTLAPNYIHAMPEPHGPNSAADHRGATCPPPGGTCLERASHAKPKEWGMHARGTLTTSAAAMCSAVCSRSPPCAAEAPAFRRAWTVGTCTPVLFHNPRTHARVPEHVRSTGAKEVCALRLWRWRH